MRRVNKIFDTFCKSIVFLFLLSFLISHLFCLFLGYVETKKDQHKRVMQVCLSIFVCALYLEITEGLTKIDCI